MTLSQLFKVPQNTYFKSIPDEFFLHSDVVLDLVSYKRINLDCSKLLAPQLNRDEIIISFQNNSIFRGYTENTTLQSKTWLIYNNDKNLQCLIRHLPDSNGITITKISLKKITNISELSHQDLIIFSKIIHNDLILWKKTEWKQQPNTKRFWKHKEIYTHGVVMERNSPDEPLKLTHTGTTNAQQLITKFKEYDPV